MWHPVYSAAAAVTALPLVAWPDQECLGLHLATAVPPASAWTTAVAACKFRR